AHKEPPMPSRWFQRWANRRLYQTRRPRGFRPLVELLEQRTLLSIYTGVVLSDAPVAYWRLGEAAGSTTAADASGHGVTGTYFNGVVLGQTGALAEDTDTAARFDGLDDHVHFANPIGDSFSVELWIKTTATSLTGTQGFQGNGLVWSDVRFTGNDWIVAVLNNKVVFFTGNPDDTISGTTLVNDGQYHHIVATRVRGGDKRLYVDGVLEATGSTNNLLLNSNPSIEVGGNTLDNRYFNGTIDEVSL